MGMLGKHQQFCHSRESGNPWPDFFNKNSICCAEPINRPMYSRFRGNEISVEGPAS